MSKKYFLLIITIFPILLMGCETGDAIPTQDTAQPTNALPEINTASPPSSPTPEATMNTMPIPPDFEGELLTLPEQLSIYAQPEYAQYPIIYPWEKMIRSEIDIWGIAEALWGEEWIQNNKNSYEIDSEGYLYRFKDKKKALRELGHNERIRIYDNEKGSFLYNWFTHNMNDDVLPVTDIPPEGEKLDQLIDESIARINLLLKDYSPYGYTREDAEILINRPMDDDIYHYSDSLSIILYQSQQPHRSSFQEVYCTVFPEGIVMISYSPIANFISNAPISGPVTLDQALYALNYTRAYTAVSTPDQHLDIIEATKIADVKLTYSNCMYIGTENFLNHRLVFAFDLENSSDQSKKQTVFVECQTGDVYAAAGESYVRIASPYIGLK